MALETFQYRYFIQAPVATVYSYLSVPANYIGLSPLVTEVSEVEHGQDAEGHSTLYYEAVETFHFLGFIRYPNRIKVTIVLTQPNRQMINLVDSNPVHMRFVFDFEAGDGGTWLTETVTANSPALLKGFTVSQAKTVQQARAKTLKQRIEGG
jgi:ligand-binding SRPBCC domain-containing protein